MILTGQNISTQKMIYVSGTLSTLSTLSNSRMGKSVSVGDTLPHPVVGVCGEFQRTGRFLQRGI